MRISPASIISKISSDFTSVYRPQSNFPGSGVLWNECINAIKDTKLMNYIVFCNDVMKIPPVKTFLMANNNVVYPFSNEEKKAIGAFWGFVFKFVFGYTQQKDNVPINTKGVKKAACFYDAGNPIEVNNNTMEAETWMVIRSSCIENIAIYSDDEKYRYILKKMWDEKLPSATFIGINPSDATELLMDKTVMNLTNRLISDGYGSVNVVNLFAFRDKNQDNVINRSDNYEQYNIDFIKKALNDSILVIVGWGRDAENNSKYRNDIAEIKKIISGFKNVKCFKDDKGCENRHISAGYNEDWTLVDYKL